MVSAHMAVPRPAAGGCHVHRMLTCFAVLWTQSDGHWVSGDQQEVRGFWALHLEFTGVSEAFVALLGLLLFD